MPRAVLKKIMPSHETIQKQKFLKIFGTLLYKKELWSLSRKKVLSGVFIGIFVAFIPMPLQMVLVALLAISFGVNLPIALALIWISNPFTMPFMYYGAYEFGNILLNRSHSIEFSIESMSSNFDAIALSLYTGSFVLGMVFSLLSVVLLNLYWIRSVKKNRTQRSNY